MLLIFVTCREIELLRQERLRQKLLEMKAKTLEPPAATPVSTSAAGIAGSHDDRNRGKSALGAGGGGGAGKYSEDEETKRRRKQQVR